MSPVVCAVVFGAAAAIAVYVLSWALACSAKIGDALQAREDLIAQRTDELEDVLRILNAPVRIEWRETW